MLRLLPISIAAMTATALAAVEPDITIRQSGEPPATANSVLTPSSMANVLGRKQYVLTPVNADVPAPPEGSTGSGLCELRFDVDVLGETSNVDVDCPDPLYARRIAKAAKRWTFEPVRVGGIPRDAKNVFMTVKYDIVTEAR